MALVGSRYIQDADPGTPPTGGYEWYKPTTDELYIRNGANTTWVLVGYSNQSSLGNVPVSGTSTTGALTGATGLAPTTSPNFSASAKRDGINLALMTDLNALGTQLRSEFQSIVASGIAAATSTSATKANIAMENGVFIACTDASAHTLPTPVYPDLTVANWSDCKYFYGIVAIGVHNLSNNFAFPSGFYITESGTSPVVLTAHCGAPTGSGSAYMDIGYFVIATR